MLLDEQADQLFAMTDPIAERVRKIGATTLRSLDDVARVRRIRDDNAGASDARAMLQALRDDNTALVHSLRAAHAACDQHEDIATASLLEVWVDGAERRVWFLGESAR